MQERSYKTAVYIDGYNLYYGRLRGSTFKWLDLHKLFARLVHEQNPSSELVAVNFFTAHALAKFASQGKASVLAQQSYHRALQTLYPPPRLTITYGSHSFDSGGTLLPKYVEGERYDRSVRERVWKIEEKQTDVNLALTLYRDVLRHRYDQVVLCTNDSDAEPALKAVREDFPDTMIGVVTPHWPSKTEQAHRRVSHTLSAHADWVRRHILDEELAAAQLPGRVPTRKKPIDKPAHW